MFSKPTADSAIMGLDSALQVVGNTRIELGVFAFDYIDVPGHGRVSNFLCFSRAEELS